jgi:hypothetical protein
MTCGFRRLQAIVCIVEAVKVRPQWVHTNSGLLHVCHCCESPRNLGSNASEYFTIFCLPVGTVKPSQPTAPTTSSKEQFSDFFFICMASVNTGLQINACVIELHKIHDDFVVRFFIVVNPLSLL